MRGAAETIEASYDAARAAASRTQAVFHRGVRRGLRFVALPYLYFFLINWKECRAGRLRAAFDVLYIFFRLKTFPYHYSLCRLWECDRSLWKYYYGSNYEPYQRARLARVIQPKEYEIVFDDKEICYRMCRDAGLPLPEQVAVLGPDDDYVPVLKAALEEHPGGLIIKPARGAGGRGIQVVKSDGRVHRAGSPGVPFPLDDLIIAGKSVVQPYLRQHRDLAAFSGCFSTVRVVTLLCPSNEVVIVGAFIRFGVDGAVVDNLSSGGIAAGVDIETGFLRDHAMNFLSMKFDRHPTSGKRFAGFRIPMWPLVVDLAVAAQRTFGFYKLLGFDIGITDEGPVIIEINPSHDNIALEQTFGPVLSNPKVLDEFRNADLLVHDMSL